MLDVTPIMDRATTKELIKRLEEVCFEIEMDRSDIAKEWLEAYIALLLRQLKEGGNFFAQNDANV